MCISHVPAPWMPYAVLLLQPQKGYIWTGEGSGKGHKDDQRCGTASQPGITKQNRLEMKWLSGDMTEVHKSQMCVTGESKLGTMGALSPPGSNWGHSVTREGGRWKTRERRRFFTQCVIKLWSTLPRDVMDTSGFKKQPGKCTKQRFRGYCHILQMQLPSLRTLNHGLAGEHTRQVVSTKPCSSSFT